MQSRIVVALDYPAQEPALALVDQLDPELCRLKVGKEMFTRFGPAWVELLQKRGFDVFLDLKFHDIPTTVAKAVEAAADLGVWMVNIHASGGRAMMTQAAETLARRAGHRPYLIAVTVLTSMSAHDLNELGFSQEPEELVCRWARMSRDVGLDGVVCSARESSMLTEQLGPGFLKVTPGIRPAFAENADQRRIMTPTAAIRAGSDYLVVGRPITQAEEPLRALQAIYREVGAALG